MIVAPRVRPARTWVAVVAVLVAFAAGVGVTLSFSGSNPTAPDRGGDSSRTGASQQNGRVSALGRLQPAGGVVPVYGPPGDRIQSMKPLAPGQFLKSGTPIATLASHEQREGDVKVAEVQFREANAALNVAKLTGQKMIDAADAEVKQLAVAEASDLEALGAKVGFIEKQRGNAVKMLSRLQMLRAEGVRVADEDIEKARLGVDQAEAEFIGAKAAKEKAVTAYAENKKAAAAKRDAAKIELNEAESKSSIKSSAERLTQAKKALDLTILKAPIDGTVLKVTGREGQPTGLEPIVQMASLDRMTVVAEVYESDVERIAEWVKKGPVPVEVTNPALPRALKGEVRSDQDITRMIARNQVFPVGPREDADRRVVEVTAHLEPEASPIAARFVGLQVTATLGPK